MGRKMSVPGVKCVLLENSLSVELENGAFLSEIIYILALHLRVFGLVLFEGKIGAWS